MTTAITLAIETSNPSAWEPGHGARPGVAIGRVQGANVQTLAIEEIDPTRVHDDSLMPAIDRVCRTCGIGPHDLHRIAVSAGPGGFTSVRIATTVAQCLSLATGAACVRVPTALVAGHGWREHAGRAVRGRVGVVLASKGDSVHLTVLDGADGTELTWPAQCEQSKIVERPEQVEALGLEPPFADLIADRFAPAWLRAWAAARAIAISPLRLTPVACLRASHGLPVIDAAAVVPIYPRPPEAVTKWRQLHPR